MTVFTSHTDTIRLSTLICEVLYTPDTGDLGLVFSTESDKVYVYRNVPAEIHTGLVRSSSLGSYYNDYIKGRYSWVDENRSDVEIRLPKTLNVTVKYSVVEVRETTLTLDQNGDLGEQIQNAVGEDSEILGVSLLV
jgi:hypothetical protein